eukprot:1337588-Amphidinium_carterae.1
MIGRTVFDKDLVCSPCQVIAKAEEVGIVVRPVRWPKPSIATDFYVDAFFGCGRGVVKVEKGFKKGGNLESVNPGITPKQWEHLEA